jgi:hypothetical protein
MPGIKDKVVVITGTSSEGIDSFVAHSLTLALGLHDLCRGVPARSIREQTAG